MEEKDNPYSTPESDFTAAGQVWMRDHVGQLRNVYIGLSLSYWGIVSVLVGVLAIVVGAFASTTAGSVAGGAFGIGGAGLAIIGLVLSFVGPFFCLAVPAESGAKGYIIASVILQLSNFVISPVLMLVDMPALSQTTAAMGGPLVAFAGIVAFVLFMRRLAGFIAVTQLVRQATHVLIGAILVFAAWILLMVISFTDFWLKTGVIGVAILLGGMIVFMMYANLINALRKQVKQHWAHESAEKPPETKDE